MPTEPIYTQGVSKKPLVRLHHTRLQFAIINGYRVLRQHPNAIA